MMLLLIISATYAYFSVTVTGNGSKSMITANTPKKHSLSVSTLYDDIHIHVDNNDMKLVHAGSYYGAVDKDNRYEKTKEEGTHQVIEVSSKGMENIRYSCSGDIKVTLNIENGSMGSVLEKEDVLLYLKGLGLDETLDLSTLKVNNTKVYNTSFEIDGNSSDYLSAIVELINKESYQNYIANKMLNVKIEAENMVCRENGTYKYLVKLNKNISDKQNDKETVKTVSIFYDEEGLYQKIQNIYLVDYINTTKAIKTWELGDTSKGTKSDEVMGWLEVTPNVEDSYDLYIGAEGPMRAPQDMGYVFYNFTNLKSITGDALDTSEVIIMNQSFQDCINLIDISALSSWSTKNTTQMYRLFYNCKSLNEINSLSNWNIFYVNDIAQMFWGCENLSDISALAHWNVLNVTSINNMFRSTNISDLTPISNWYFPKLTSTSGMFFGCNNITDINPLEKWDMSHIINLSNMFDGTSLSDLSSITKWNLASATNINSLFNGTKISDLTPISDFFDFTKVTNIGGLFANTLVTDLSPIANWDVSHVTNMQSLFDSLSLTNLTPIGSWDVSSVTNMQGLFQYSSKLVDISPLKEWNVQSVTNMNSMFYYTSIKDLTPLKDWNVSHVTSMSDTFTACGGLSDISPLSRWNVSNVTDMSNMFNGTKLKDISPIANWDVSKVTNVGYKTAYGSFAGMFSGNQNLVTVDLSNWQMSKLASVVGMFRGCTNLIEIKLPQAAYSTITNKTNYEAMFGVFNDTNNASVSNNITIYVASEHIDWVKARLQEALGENNHSTVQAYNSN